GTTYSVTVQALVDAVTAGNLLVALRTLVLSWKQGRALTAVVPWLVVQYAIFHIVVSLTCTLWAVSRLRIAAGVPMVAPKADAPRRWWRWPSLDRNELLWKELAIDPGLRLNRMARIVVTALAVASFVPAIAVLYNFSIDMMQEPTGNALDNLWRNL